MSQLPTFQPQRLLPVSVGVLILTGCGGLVWLGSQIGEWMLHVLGGSGGLLGLVMAVEPFLARKRVEVGQAGLRLGRRRYPWNRVRVERIRSEEIRGLEVRTFNLELIEPDGRKRRVTLNANTYRRFEEMHRCLKSAAAPRASVKGGREDG